jgi:hypothetical protein
MGDLLTTVGMLRQSRCVEQGDRAAAIAAYACLARLRKWTAGWPYVAVNGMTGRQDGKLMSRCSTSASGVAALSSKAAGWNLGVAFGAFIIEYRTGRCAGAAVGKRLRAR